MSNTDFRSIDTLISSVPTLKGDNLVGNVNNYTFLNGYNISALIAISCSCYHGNNKTLIRTNNAIYWLQEKAFVYYQNKNEKTIYLNETLKRRLNWEKTVNKYNYNSFEVKWVSTEFFEQYIVSLDRCKFKNLTEKRQSLEKFRNWLKYRFINSPDNYTPIYESIAF